MFDWNCELKQCVGESINFGKLETVNIVEVYISVFSIFRRRYKRGYRREFIT